MKDIDKIPLTELGGNFQTYEMRLGLMEKADLLVKLYETSRLVETLIVENTSLEEKVKNLEVELSQARTQIERMSSAKLDEVLSAKKPSSDKTEIGRASCRERVCMLV